MKNCIFSLRLVDADFSLEKPILDLDDLHSEFRDSKTDRVPVIRLFGSTSVGQKTCFHVHGVYPYLYIIPPKANNEALLALLKRMASEIDLALHVSLGKPPSNLPRYVHNIDIVNGRQFYGYHQDEQQFCKISLYNPMLIKRLADLFLNGSILGMSFQPHEAHIPYLLQFFMDFNLHGMNFVHFNSIKFRRPIVKDYWCIENDVQPTNTPDSFVNNSEGQHSISNNSDGKILSPDRSQTSFIASSQVWTENTISTDDWLDEKVTRQSTCSLEADAHCSAILNQHSIHATIGKNPGLIAIWEDEQERRRLKGIESQLVPASSQERPEMNLVFETEANYLDLLKNYIDHRQNLENSGNESSNNDTDLFPTDVTASQPSQRLQSQTLSNSFDQSLIDALGSLEGSQSMLSISETQSSSQHNGISIIEETIVESDEAVDDEEDESFVMSQTLDNLMANLSPTNPKFADVACKTAINSVCDALESDSNAADEIDSLELNVGNHKTGKSIFIDDGHYVVCSEAKRTDDVMPSASISQVDGNDDSSSSSNGSLSGDASIPLPRKKRKVMKSRKALQFQSLNPGKSSKSKAKQSTDPDSPVVQRSFSSDNLPPLLNVKIVCKNRKRKRIGVLDVTGSPSSSQSVPNSSNESLHTINNDQALFCQFEDQISYSPLKDKIKINVGTTPQSPRRQRLKTSRINKQRGRRKTSSTDDKLASNSLCGKVHFTGENVMSKNINESSKLTAFPSCATNDDTDNSSSSTIFHISPFQLPDEQQYDSLHEDVLNHLSPISPLKRHNFVSSPPLPTSPSERIIKDTKNKLFPLKLADCSISAATSTNARDNDYHAYEEFSKKQTKESVTASDNYNKHLTDGSPTRTTQIAVPIATTTSSFENRAHINTADNRASSVYQQAASENAITLLSPLRGVNTDVKSSSRNLQAQSGNRRASKHHSPFSTFADVKRSIESSFNTNLDGKLIKDRSPNTTSGLKDHKKLSKVIQMKTLSPSFTSNPNKSTTATQSTRTSHTIMKVSSSTSKGVPTNKKTLRIPIEKTSSTPQMKHSVEPPSENDCHSIDSLGHSDNTFETIVDQIMTSCGEEMPLINKATNGYIVPLMPPPSYQDAVDEISRNELVFVQYQRPFCSNQADVQKSRSVGSRILKVGCKSIKDLPYFESNAHFNNCLTKLKESSHSLNTSLIDELEFQQARDLMLSLHHVIITPVLVPPSPKLAQQWLDSTASKLNTKDNKPSTHSSQGSTVTHSQKAFAESFCSGPSAESSSSPYQATHGLHSTPEKKVQDLNMHNLQTPGLSPVAVDRKHSNTQEPSTTPKRGFAHPKSLLIKKLSVGTKKQSIVQKNLSLARRRSRPILTDSSQIDGPTPKNTCGFNISKQDLEGSKAVHEIQFLSVLSVELHIKTRSDNHPDPTMDPICAIFYHLVHDSKDTEIKYKETGLYILLQDSATLDTSKPDHEDNHLNLLQRAGVTGIKVFEFSNEKDMILEFTRFITFNDPDILLGYEIQLLSWGYLVQRAGHLDMNITPLLSRIPNSKGSVMKEDNEEEMFMFGSARDITITGRIVLNLWRIMRSEVTLNIYTFENVAFHVLHERYPKFPFRSLTDWWSESNPLHLSKVVSYYIDRCCANYRILESVDFFGRTSELARVFGILFFSVISRGSQYRVESMMLRIAKPMKYIAVSPSVQQRARMAAPECIPLVMEPESRLYVDPVIVLDFQSLYPSIMIAYNYCFSTCLGRVSRLAESGPFTFGTTSLSVPTKVLKNLLEVDGLTVSPNGVVFVKDEIRKGILPSMLKEILETRIMVKTSMKKNKDTKSLHRLLDARQLGLKLIANVTYGYTSANFSGRMPSVEIADSIVRKARETLERAIALVNDTKKWNARVVYGDTDSLFILVKGASKQRAFDVAKEIMAEVTQQNPKPVKLKFEKVYLPCVLQTKKRYVGYMYESVDQSTPVFDAKGIETVRRDGCPAVAKILERSLRILFETKDVSLIKRYVQRQFKKISEGSVSLQDFIIAKEYRGMKNYKPTACVPALELARKAVARDKRSEPRPGERVPYVVISGPPGVPLIQLVRKPLQVMKDPALRLNSLYYITKQIIPPLNRFLLLIGVDAHLWFADLPRTSRVSLPNQKRSTNKGTISQYFSTLNCTVCSELTRSEVCENCIKNPQLVCYTLAQRLKKLEKTWDCLCKICSQCTESVQGFQRCCSLDCPVKHKLYKITLQINNQDRVRDVLTSFLNVKDIEDVMNL